MAVNGRRVRTCPRTSGVEVGHTLLLGLTALLQRTWLVVDSLDLEECHVLRSRTLAEEYGVDGAELHVKGEAGLQGRRW